MDHNRRYWPVVFEAIAALPERPRRALDVGCGTGVLTRELGRLATEAIGIDRDEPCLAEARRLGGATYVAGDFLTFDFGGDRFDVVAAAALARMKEVLLPGGLLVVIGLARNDGLADLARSGAAVVAGPLLELTTRSRSGAEPGAEAQPNGSAHAPTLWPPSVTYASMRRVAEPVLPGVRYRRHLFWRYSLVWRNRLGGSLPDVSGGDAKREATGPRRFGRPR
jgi:SAM-dependent methyltransferase